MISVSDKFLEIVNSNVRPPIKPIIKVSGRDANSNYISLTWNSNNIIDMSFKRGIDPTGQNLPFMELTWKEFYFGKLNSENYPEKYDNIVKYLMVDLSFELEQTTVRTWGDVSTLTWDELSSTLGTWGNVKKEKTSFVVSSIPKMMLLAKPTIDGHTITWTARDFMYFLDSEVSKSFAKDIAYENPIRWLLLNESTRFLENSLEQWYYLRDTQDFTMPSEANLTDLLIFEGQTKNLLKDYASPRGYYWDFSKSKMELKNFSTLINKTSPVFKFTKKIMRSNPKLSRNPDVLDYQFKRYYAESDTENSYTMTPTGSVTYKYGLLQSKSVEVPEYLYKGFGYSTAQSSQDSLIAKKGYGSPSIESEEITVTPVNYNSYDEKITIGLRGDSYVEDNKLNPYSASSTYMQNRASNLDKWYSSKYLIIIDSLSNFALELGDLIQAETNLYDGSDEVIKNAIIIQIEMTYNGVLKQKTYAHEVG